MIGIVDVLFLSIAAFLAASSVPVFCFLKLKFCLFQLVTKGSLCLRSPPLQSNRQIKRKEKLQGVSGLCDGEHSSAIETCMTISHTDALPSPALESRISVVYFREQKQFR